MNTCPYTFFCQSSMPTSSSRVSMPSAWSHANLAETRRSTSSLALPWCTRRRRSPSRAGSSSSTTLTVSRLKNGAFNQVAFFYCLYHSGHYLCSHAVFPLIGTFSFCPPPFPPGSSGFPKVPSHRFSLDRLPPKLSVCHSFLVVCPPHAHIFGPMILVNMYAPVEIFLFKRPHERQFDSVSTVERHYEYRFES